MENPGNKKWNRIMFSAGAKEQYKRYREAARSSSVKKKLYSDNFLTSPVTLSKSKALLKETSTPSSPCRNAKREANSKLQNMECHIVIIYNYIVYDYFIIIIYIIIQKCCRHFWCYTNSWSRKLSIVWSTSRSENRFQWWQWNVAKWGYKEAECTFK